jgi:hypothetical protein
LLKEYLNPVFIRGLLKKLKILKILNYLNGKESQCIELNVKVKHYGKHYYNYFQSQPEIIQEANKAMKFVLFL